MDIPWPGEFVFWHLLSRSIQGFRRHCAGAVISWLSLRRKIRAVADGDAATWPGYAHVALPIARRIPFAPRFRLVVVAAGGDEPSTCLVLLTGTALCCIFQAQWARYIIYLHDFPGDHLNQSPFQDPKLEVPTIYKAYVRPKFQGISPQNMAWNMVQYLQFRILEFPLTESESNLSTRSSYQIDCVFWLRGCPK
jgi:hypothetical protein